MKTVIDDLVKILAAGEQVVSVTIIRSKGSAPRSAGARMLVRTDGSIAGTVGGGMVEERCRRMAETMLKESADYTMMEIELDGDSIASDGMVCGGNVTVLLQMVRPDEVELYRRVVAELQQNKRPVMYTSLPKGNRPPQTAALSSEPQNELERNVAVSLPGGKPCTPFLIESAGIEVFVEPLASSGLVYLVGGGHVALATARLAAYVDFELVVIDDREDFANRDRFPGAREVRVVESFANCLGDLSEGDYVVIVTRGHLHDRDVLAQALRTGAGYVGMIGSRKKRDMIYESLLAEGFSEKDLDRVHSPIGTPIGAETPNEIGVSIVGELISFRSKTASRGGVVPVRL